MRKRPACVACLLFLLGMMIFGDPPGRSFPGVDSSGRKSPGWENEARVPAGGIEASAVGQVYKREEKASSLQIYLKNITILSNSSENQADLESQSHSEDQTDPNSQVNSEDQADPNSRVNSEDQADPNNQLKSELENSNLLVRMDKNDEKLKIGSWVQVAGKLKLPEEAANPGQFDFAAYYAGQGVGWILDKARCTGMSDSWNIPLELLCRLREGLTGLFERVGGEDAGFLEAMMLGNKTNLDSDMKKLYQAGGISHILAISGLHISLLGMGLYRLLQKRGAGFWASGLASGLVMTAYCLMTGFGVSAQRALFMYLIYLGAQAAGRTYDLLSALAAAAILILIKSPSLLGDASFLLSFLAVLGLGLVYPLLLSCFPVKNKILQSLAAGISIQVMTVPVSLWFFYEVSIWGLALNLLVLPLLPILMAAGAAAAAAGLFGTSIGILCFAPCHYILKFYEILCQAANRLPGSGIAAGQPEPWQLLVCYLCTGGFCIWAWYRGRSGDQKQDRIRGRSGDQKQNSIRGRSRNKICDRLAAAVSALIFCLTLSYSDNSGLVVTVLDVGQGDAICIRGEGRTFLIDGGSSSVKDVGEYRIAPYLKSQGISYLDGVVLTHGDEDHINGICELMEEDEDIVIASLLLPDIKTEDSIYEELEEAARRHNIPVQKLGSGMRFGEGSLSMECLHPKSGYRSGSRNGESIVILLTYGDFSALFTGDLEAKEEEMLLGQGIFPDIDVLKVAHHGSRNSTMEAFLNTAKPEAAIISCGEDSRYGHPHRELLKRLKDAGCRYFITKEEGAVRIRTDGHKYTIEGYRKRK